MLTILLVHLAGGYQYTGKLTRLHWCMPANRFIHPALWEVCMPLKVSVRQAALRKHTNQTFVHYIRNGLSNRLRGGFKCLQALISAHKSLPSTREQENVFSSYPKMELMLGRIFGPLQPSSARHTDRLGIFPKTTHPGNGVSSPTCCTCPSLASTTGLPESQYTAVCHS